MNNSFRHEQKYICSLKQLEALKEVLSSVMSCDRFASDQGYLVSSLYFDTQNDRFLSESINGFSYRQKYRIRSYNGDTEKLKLECKEAFFHMKRKKFISLKIGDAERLIAGEICKNTDIFEGFNYLKKTELLQPKIVINYNRRAFVDPDFNIRITLDQNINVSDDVDSFLKSQNLFQPAMDSHFGILEVKFDTFLPGYIKEILKFEDLEQKSFSKYAAGRVALDSSLNYLK